MEPSAKSCVSAVGVAKEEADVLGWLIGIVGLVIAATVAVGGLGAANAGEAMLLCGAFAILFIAALLAVAAGGSSRTD